MKDLINMWLTGIFLALFAASSFSCSKAEMPGGDLEVSDSLAHNDVPLIRVYSKNRMQKVLQWGHDIKQENKAPNLTVEACRQIFQNGRFNLLRIPIYANAHNADGTVKRDYLVYSATTENPGQTAQWEVIPAAGDWILLRNLAHEKYLNGFNDNAVEMDTAHQGGSAEWKLVDAGEGSYHLLNREYNKFIKGDDNGNISLVETGNTGVWTQWKLADAGNGRCHLIRKDGKRVITGGGSAYQPVVDAIIRARDNGKPDLYASHKIYDSNDHTTTRNANFGPFYTADGIDVDGFAACINHYMQYIYEQTGESIKYLAPRCELGNHWNADDLVQVVKKLDNPPLIVGPEAAYTINSEKWVTQTAGVTAIRSTHNKEHSPLWPVDAKYDWDGETVGGNGENFSKLFFKLHEALYKGEVTGIVFWGDTHLLNTNEDGNNGRFRRELVDASAYRLIECEKAFNLDRSAIAFETGAENTIKVFYTSTGSVNFVFDRPVDVSSIPQSAKHVTGYSFTMEATGTLNYGSFTVKF